MNVTVLDYLFNKLPKIKALDFCGASSELFARAFNELQITREDLSIQNYLSMIVQTWLRRSLKKYSHI